VRRRAHSVWLTRMSRRPRRALGRNRVSASSAATDLDADGIRPVPYEPANFAGPDALGERKRAPSIGVVACTARAAPKRRGRHTGTVTYAGFPIGSAQRSPLFLFARELPPHSERIREHPGLGAPERVVQRKSYFAANGEGLEFLPHVRHIVEVERELPVTVTTGAPPGGLKSMAFSGVPSNAM
jgi:hypothetical protein